LGSPSERCGRIIIARQFIALVRAYWRGVIVSETGLTEAYDVIMVGGGLAGAAG
jgi:hypothetical protein